MKKSPKLKKYYEEYLEVCSSISPKSELLALRKYEKVKFTGIEFSLSSGICLLDYSKRQYHYISDNCHEIHSHSKNSYMEGGLDFHIGIWHPEDKIVYDEQVFRDIREFWNHINSQEFSKYRFSFNHRYLRTDGTISQLLQHGTYIEPHTGLPILNLVVFSDIGDFKTDNSIVLTISRLDSVVGYVKVFSKTYIPKRKSVLSARESEVLQLSLDGLSSKTIAAKLFISIQTVKNHKRNMMEKTSTKNIVELINLSLKNSWV